MIDMSVRHQHLREVCTGKRVLDGIEVPGIAYARVDERRHAPGNQPRPVAGAVIGPG